MCLAVDNANYHGRDGDILSIDDTLFIWVNVEFELVEIRSELVCVGYRVGCMLLQKIENYLLLYLYIMMRMSMYNINILHIISFSTYFAFIGQIIRDVYSRVKFLAKIDLIEHEVKIKCHIVQFIGINTTLN